MGSWACDENTGNKKIYRQGDNPPPRNGGLSCPGSSSEIGTCVGMSFNETS